MKREETEEKDVLIKFIPREKSLSKLYIFKA